MTRQHYTQFNVGDRVRASDGTKRPPDRHCRKLRAWKDRNFTGTVHEVQEPTTIGGELYRPNGGLVLTRDDYPDRSYMVFRFHHDLGGTVEFEKEAA